MRGQVSIWLNRAVQDPYVFFEFYGPNGQLCWSYGRYDFEGSWPGKRIYEFDYLWAPHRGAVLCPCKPAYATTYLVVRVNGPTQDGPTILADAST